ncbi:MAG: TetR family transcriptional regulator [Deltaproteobacteria bacterium]|nr:TetR family transcriptional regulator [Deltaproteobacteria bacterium]
MFHSRPMSAAFHEPEMEERARRIVETAIELAEQGGFEAVRLRDVAAHAGVALGTLYRRFRSKEDLLVAALELETRALEQRVRQRPPKGPEMADRLIDFFAIATRGMLRRPNLSRAMLKAAASGEPELAQRVGDFHSNVRRMAVGAMRGTRVDPDDDSLSDRELLLGDVLNQIWFALMVGWSGGLHNQAAIQAKMRAAVRLVLGGSDERFQSSRPGREFEQRVMERG